MSGALLCATPGTVVAGSLLRPIMKVPDQSAERASLCGRRSFSSSGSAASSNRATRTASVCNCNAAKLDAVHAYLQEQFPDCELSDLHAPMRLMHAGLPTPHAEHHVVCISQGDVPPYYAVLLNDFQEHSVEAIGHCLRQWNFAATVRAQRIGIASRSGAGAL